MNRISPIFLGLLALTVVGAVLLGVSGDVGFTLDGMDAGVGTFAGAIMLVFGGWAVSLCLHEFGHAYVAHRGGDWSVRHKGYLTLDPRRYTDPVLSILLPLLFVAIGGIPLPGGAVWINRQSLRNRGVASSVSLAGPGTNLVLGAIFALITAFAGLTALDSSSGGISALGLALSYLALLQLIAFFINILPIPGLDGWGAIEPWLSPQAQRFGAQVRPYAPLALFVILIAIPGASGVLFQVGGAILQLFGGDERFAFEGQSLAMPWQL